MSWKKVLATFEEEQELATGPWLGPDYMGVALPSGKALRRWVILRYGEKEVRARVMDVGPWCIDDNDYVFGSEQPRAEKLKGKPCPRKLGTHHLATVPDGKGGWIAIAKSNGAGIDLFPAVIKALGLKTNTVIEWKFEDLPASES